jgi:hypothetical protein
MRPAVMLSGMKLGVVLLAALLCASELAAQTSASNFLTWLQEAGAAIRFEDRLRTHERALDAILKADAATLEGVLLLWCRDDDRYRNNDFVQMTWRRLAQIDTPRAVKLLENVDDEYAFYLNAKEVWAEVARTDPVRAYMAAQGFVPQNGERHERKWLVQHIMQAVGATWFRTAGLETLKRLSTLSHPELMATSVFKGCVSEASTGEQKIALLDRFAGDEKPVIVEITAKGPDLCEELVRAAARADLPGTRSWIEKRFPPGTKRERDWHVEHARRTLFDVWRDQDALVAADWFIAQQHRDEDSDSAHAICLGASAIAGEDRENMPAALAWLEKQARPQDRVAALVDFLDDDFGEDTVLRQSRQIIAVWLSQRPIAEREAVVLTAAEDYIRIQAKGDFLTIVFPDEPKRREMVVRLDKITGPPSNFEENSFMLRVFDLKPHRDKKLVVSAADADRSRELARLHELQRTGADPARRREGLEALKWMKSAAPVQIGPVLLAYLQNHRMDWFSEDLLSAWVLQDWHECEAFATNAPLSAHKRDRMLIHIFAMAAEQHPDEVLVRLRELVQAKVLVPAALNGGSVGSRVMWLTSYDGEMIIRSLTHGLLRQGDMKALAMVRTLPTGWQIGAFEVLSESFATPECGKAVLDHFEHADKEQRERHGEIVQDYTREVTQVISRLASISPADAVRWLESRPERLGEHEWRDSPLCRVHAVWSKTNPKTADAWMERVRRENPPKKSDPSTPVIKAPATGPSLPSLR